MYIRGLGNKCEPMHAFATHPCDENSKYLPALCKVIQRCVVCDGGWELKCSSQCISVTYVFELVRYRGVKLLTGATEF